MSSRKMKSKKSYPNDGLEHWFRKYYFYSYLEVVLSKPNGHEKARLPFDKRARIP